MNLIKIIIKLFSQKNKLKRLFHAFKVCLQNPVLYPLHSCDNINIEECIQRYIDYIDTANHYANLKGITYFSFLQPFNGYSKRKLSQFDKAATAHIARRKTTDGSNELELIQKFYNELWSRVRDYNYVFDLRDALNDYPDEIYFDQVHFSDIGYDIIAKLMAININNQLKDNCCRKEAGGDCYD